MFELMSAIFPVIFILVLGIILFSIFRNVQQWNYNNKQPVLTVDASIVSKRAHTSRSTSNHQGHHHHRTRTTYYVTFEVESGDRMELHVPDQEYGLLAEGDRGKLTFQGTRYHGFERI
jgi:hypothetical protein